MSHAVNTALIHKKLKQINAFMDNNDCKLKKTQISELLALYHAFPLKSTFYFCKTACSGPFIWSYHETKLKRNGSKQEKNECQATQLRDCSAWEKNPFNILFLSVQSITELGQIDTYNRLKYSTTQSKFRNKNSWNCYIISSKFPTMKKGQSEGSYYSNIWKHNIKFYRFD